MFWKCPECLGDLAQSAEAVTCVSCGRRYPVVAELPDFRVDKPAWIDFDRDRDRALLIDAMIRSQGLEAAIYDVFRSSRGFDPAKCRFRTKQVLAGADKCDLQLDDWLKDAMVSPVLEVGVGPGQLTVALARRGIAAHGIDVSMEWLMVAKHRARAQGAEPVLAGAMAEKLPVADAAVASFISLDVIEHVGDQDQYVRELGRVLRPGGRYALVTPNRYSLSPEPHVGVWGVGYLPRPLQASWVRAVAGVGYDYTRLLSTREIRCMFQQRAGLEPTVTFPEIAEAEIGLFPPFKASIARTYNKIIAARIVQPVAPFVGAYFRVTGSKPLLSKPPPSNIPPTKPAAAAQKTGA